MQCNLQSVQCIRVHGCIEQGSTDFFYKGPGNRYFRLCGLYSSILLQLLSSVLLARKQPQTIQFCAMACMCLQKVMCQKLNLKYSNVDKYNFWEVTGPQGLWPYEWVNPCIDELISELLWEWLCYDSELSLAHLFCLTM